MPYTDFNSKFPEIAERETRSVTVTSESDGALPSGQYVFIEMFCDEKGCDCRRVFFKVFSPERKEIVAVIAWGWESRAFYRKWFRHNDSQVIKSLIGPELNLGSPQSSLAPELLEFAKHVLLQDKDYVARIKRHYLMFRAEIDRKQPGTKRLGLAGRPA